jgi:hypothetical protein
MAGNGTIANRHWGFSVVVAAVVGIGIGVLVAVLAGLGSGSRLVIGIGIGLIIGGGLLAIFDRAVVRPATPAFDPQTGERLPRAVGTSLLGLSLEVWTLVLVGLGILGVGVGAVLYLMT